MLSSLIAVGANDIAEIYRPALANFPSELSKDDAQKETILDQWMNEEVLELLDSCDRQFYEYSDHLENLLYQFIMNHKTSFI